MQLKDIATVVDMTTKLTNMNDRREDRKKQNRFEAQYKHHLANFETGENTQINQKDPEFDMAAFQAARKTHYQNEAQSWARDKRQGQKTHAGALEQFHQGDWETSFKTLAPVYGQIHDGGSLEGVVKNDAGAQVIRVKQADGSIIDKPYTKETVGNLLGQAGAMFEPKAYVQHRMESKFRRAAFNQASRVKQEAMVDDKGNVIFRENHWHRDGTVGHIYPPETHTNDRSKWKREAPEGYMPLETEMALKKLNKKDGKLNSRYPKTFDTTWWTMDEYADGAPQMIFGRDAIARFYNKADDKSKGLLLTRVLPAFQAALQTLDGNGKGTYQGKEINLIDKDGGLLRTNELLKHIYVSEYEAIYGGSKDQGRTDVAKGAGKDTPDLEKSEKKPARVKPVAESPGPVAASEKHPLWNIMQRHLNSDPQKSEKKPTSVEPNLKLAIGGLFRKQ